MFIIIEIKISKQLKNLHYEWVSGAKLPQNIFENIEKICCSTIYLYETNRGQLKEGQES